MLFVGYDSRRDGIRGPAARLRKHLPHLYPHLPDRFLVASGERLRPRAVEPYRELFLVGHSLGGVVVRAALLESARLWLEGRSDGRTVPRPVLLDAEVRLFSPASAGVRFGGVAGMLRATGIWAGIEMYLRRSPAYSDLQPDSEVLKDLRKQTEEHAAAYGADLGALSARIAWANPDYVVLAIDYKSDHVGEVVDGTRHATVCKPTPAFATPQVFVERGTLM
jgi:alpha-beta hydrolase superfamily lysophospholipase